MNKKSQTWVAFWIAVIVPQFVTVVSIANNWQGIVKTAPLMAAGLLGVVEVAAGVAVLAAIVAAVAILRTQGRHA
jgi:hypothetical protein